MTDEHDRRREALNQAIWTAEEREAWLQRLDGVLDTFSHAELKVLAKGFADRREESREANHERLEALWTELYAVVNQAKLRWLQHQTTLTDEQLQRLVTPEEE